MTFVQLPFVVTVERWFQSKEMWNYIAGLALIICPIIADKIGSLGLPDGWLLLWTVLVALASYSAGMYLKYQSNAVIGTKSDVQATPPSAP